MRTISITAVLFSIFQGAFLPQIQVIYDRGLKQTSPALNESISNPSGFLNQRTSLTPSSVVAWDGYCRGQESSSYCKYWQRPSRCHGTDFLCGLDGNSDELGCVLSSSLTPVFPQPFTSVCDVYCDRFVLPGTVCEWWNSGEPMCSGSEAPCSRALCEERVQMAERCDRFCQTFAGALSFCKGPDNICHGSEISCAPAECVKPNDVCDSLCGSLNGKGSFCIFWRDRKQCSGGGQDCDASQCY